MLAPLFSLKLKQKILPRRVTLGKFDGVNPNLACATSAGKVQYFYSTSSVLLQYFYSIEYFYSTFTVIYSTFTVLLRSFRILQANYQDLSKFSKIQQLIETSNCYQSIYDSS